MTPDKSRAIVLSRREYRETSLLISFFTRDFGHLSGIIKGIRTASALEYTRVEPCSLVDIVFYPRKRGNLYLVTQCDLVDFFDNLRHDLDKLSWAHYALEIVNSMTMPSAIHSVEIFDLLTQALKNIAEAEKPIKPALLFAYKFLQLNGLVDDKLQGKMPVNALKKELDQIISAQLDRNLRTSKFIASI